MIFKSLTTSLIAKVLGGALVGSLLLSSGLGIGLYLTRSKLNGAKEVIQSLTTWRDDTVQATRLASGNLQLTPDTTRAQIQAMGQDLITLTNTLKTSNDAVDRLAEEKRQAELVAEREAKKRAAAIKRAEELAAQLRISAESPVAPADMEAEIRRAQDLAYESGL